MNGHSMSSATDGGRSIRAEPQRWIRSEPTSAAWTNWLPLIALALLAMYAMRPFARDDIESTVRGETRAALDAQGMQWAELEVSGQNVLLRGSPPDERAGEAALAVARAAHCPTWLGRFACAVSVSGQFAAVTALPPRVESAPVAVEPAAAASLLPAASPLPAAAANCEKAFAAIVARSPIEFASSSATIESRSGAVLDALAKVAADCPGRIVIEGHTDSLGPPPANRALSLERADAVLAALALRGLPPGRLRAKGVGADRPLADNGSAEGRAKNRRIEFRLVSGSD